MAEDENMLPGVVPYIPLFKPVFNVLIIQEQIVADYVADCETRIIRRFAEMGVRLEIRIPEGTPPLQHYPRRRLRSVWLL